MTDQMTLRAFMSAAALALVLAGCFGSGSGGAGNSTGSSPPISSPKVSPAVAGDASVTLYWSGVYPASSYNLYWSTTPGVSKTNGNKIAGAGSPYDHTKLANGTTYYYVVTAVDVSGTESAESSQVSATPVAPSISGPQMSPPVAGDASVTLYWSGAYPASSYNLYWSTTPGVSKTNGNKIAGAGSPYNHTQLSNGTTYYYVVTAVDGSGAESAESSQVSATPVAPAGGWSAGTQIGVSSDVYSFYPLSVQINDAGTAVAMWLSAHPLWWDASSLSVSIYQGGAWHAPTGFGLAYSPSVALTAGGDAIAVYCQPSYDATGLLVRTLINSRRYDHLTGTWSAARPISIKDWSFAGHPDIAIDSNGNAIAIWDEDSQTWARRFDAALGAWETSATNLSVRYVPHRIVVDGSNIFTAVWVENSTVFARRFNATPNTWDASIRIGYDPAVLPGASDLQVDVNTAGNIFVVWQQKTTLPDNTSRYSIDSSRFDPVTNTWSAPAALTASASLAHSPRVAVDNAGNAMAAWLQTGTTGSSLQTARFAATGSTWSAPMLTEQTGTGTIASIVLGMDGNGNAEVIWLDTAAGIVERRYNAATSTWSGFNTSFGPKPNALIGAMSDSGYAALLGDVTASWSEAVWGWILAP